MCIKSFQFYPRTDFVVVLLFSLSFIIMHEFRFGCTIKIQLSMHARQFVWKWLCVSPPFISNGSQQVEWDFFLSSFFFPCAAWKLLLLECRWMSFCFSIPFVAKSFAQSDFIWLSCNCLTSGALAASVMCTFSFWQRLFTWIYQWPTFVHWIIWTVQSAQ